MDQAAEHQPKETPLARWHADHGATMALFAGWSMPLWYPAGAVKEHLSVLTSAGIFDTSHMSVLGLEGPAAYELLQRTFTKDLSACVGKAGAPLRPGTCTYGAFLDEQGGSMDDAIVYHLGPERYMVVVNASMGERISGHLNAHMTSDDAHLTDLTEHVGKMDLQGPQSARILLKIVRNAQDTLSDMTYFSFKGHFDSDSFRADTFLRDGTPVLVSRTGYTGEFGFEIFVARDRLVPMWESILAAGADLGVLACGLAARDSLRAGACLPLSHQDIGPWPFINNPWPYALPYNRDRTAFTKAFIGDAILQMREQAPHTYAFVGYDPRKVSLHDATTVTDTGGTEIGKVLTCVTDMAIGWHEGRIYSVASARRPRDFKPRGLSCGFVRVASRLTVGQEVRLRDGKREITVRIVDEIRPDRTARRPMAEMLGEKEERP